MHHDFSKIWIIVIIIVLLFGGIFGYQWWTGKTEVKILEVKPSEEITKNETADWKIYRNEEYRFEFKYPDNWISDGEICGLYTNPTENVFCLSLLDYNELPENKDVEVCFEIPPDMCTKEGFDSLKNAISSGNLPAGFGKLIKVDGRNARQAIYYEIYGGYYLIETLIFENNARISLQAKLPIKPFYKNAEETYLDVTKNLAREEELSNNIFNNIFPNEETKTLISQYNQVLSTFRFLE